MEQHTALVKAEHYCAYQERSKLEVMRKLQEWEVSPEDQEAIINQLEDNRYLDEERFARAYSLGKFRMKGWGKNKIRQGLSLKGLSDKQIEKGLKEINQEDYLQRLRDVIEKKYELTDIFNPLLKKHTVAKYLIGQGFETNLIWDIVDRLEIKPLKKNL